MTQKTSQDDKLPPYSEEAQEAVLGAILVDPGALALVAPILNPDDFYPCADHPRIYRAMLAAQGRGDVPDAVAVSAEMGPGSMETLTVLVGSSYHSPAYAEHYARIVERMATRRRLIDAAAEVTAAAWDESKPLPEVEDMALEKMAAARSRSARQAKPLSELVRAYYDRLEALAGKDGPLGLPTGYKDLDTLLRGLHRSDMVVLAGRPGMGKSSLAYGIARNAGQMNATVAYFTLEMSDEQSVQRLISMESGLGVQVLREGKVGPDDWPSLMDGMDKLDRSAIWIDDTPGASPAHVRSASMRVRALAGGLDLIVIDYLQLMRPAGRSRGRYEDVTMISQDLKALARDLDVPVLALSQLSRLCEQRSDKRPMLSDLRESGAIEQDADAVLFLYRDEYYNDNTEHKNIAELNVAKHRNGPTGTVALFFKKDQAAFLDVEVRKRQIDDSTWL